MKFTTKLLDVMQDRKNLIERLQNETNSGVLLHSTFITSVWQLRGRLKIRLRAFLQVVHIACRPSQVSPKVHNHKNYHNGSIHTT